MSAFNSMAGGGGSAIQAALARRAGSPMQTQQGPAAPTFNPAIQQTPVQGGGVPGIPSPMPQAPAPAPAPVPAPAPAAPQMSAMGAVNPNDTLIIKALAAKLNEKQPGV